MGEVSDRLSAALSGRYAIEREVGAGGMATVYLAHDLKHDRRVALKVLRPELAAALGAERFLSEIRTTANLQHPHILPLFDSGEAGGFLFYVMPYVEGESLRQRLDRERQLSVDATLDIARGVAAALQYAHEQGVIHRDIKPANILLVRGEPVVADFGIALAVSEAGGGRVTETGLSLGTPHYMSPEQAVGERTVGPQSDLYSLGCLLYEALIGEPPYVGPTAQSVLAKILTERPRRVADVRRAVPKNIDAALARALEKLPADRFESADAFARALKDPGFRYEPDDPAGFALAHSDRRGGTPRGRWRAALPWAIAGLAILAAAATTWSAASEPSPVAVSSIMPPDGYDFSETESFGALSPDGMRFAFVTLGRRGETQLWIQRLDSLAAVPVAGTSGAVAPFWSADGARIAFLSLDRLQVLELGTGNVRPVCEIPSGYAGSWDDRDVAAVAARDGIWRVDMDAGTCVLAIQRDSLTFDMRRVSMLGDGKRVLFSGRATRDGVPNSVTVADLETGEVRIAVEDASNPMVVGDVLLFTRPSGGRSVVWAQPFDRRSGEVRGDPKVLSGQVRTAAGAASYTASAAGTLLYLPAWGDRGQLLADSTGRVIDTVGVSASWTFQWARTKPLLAVATNPMLFAFDAARGVSTPLSVPGTLFSPAWSPGDSLIAYGSCDAGFLRCGIGVTRMADEHNTLLVQPDSGFALFPSSWSPDGRFLVYSRTYGFQRLGSQVWAYDSLERSASRVLSTAFSAAEGAVSSDGRWIAYVSNEAGTWEIFVRPWRASGDQHRVSVDGGRRPRWSADGKTLYFQTPDGVIMAAGVRAGSTFEADPPRALFTAPEWSRHLFFDSGTSFDVSADGKTFAVRMSATVATAVLVHNWRALMKR
jgi:Tol biopolymer transport system component/tRNA A-37 threonylcarbamoyl transferase component Bud32